MRTSVKKLSTKKLTALLLATAVLGTTAFVCGFGFTSKSANAATRDVESSGLGLSVNAVTTRYLDLTEFKDGSPIFDTSWLATQIDNANYQAVRETSTKSYKAATFTDMVSQYSADLKFNSSVTGGTDLFTVGLSNGFTEGSSVSYSKYSSNYFYLFNGKIQSYTLSLPYFSSDLSSYKEHLSTQYLTALDNAINGRITYKQLFDTYGTHVVMKGIFGGDLNLFYGAASSAYDVGGRYKAAIDTGLNTFVEPEGGSGSSTSYSLSDILNTTSSQYVETTHIVAHGGNAFGGTSVNDFKKHYNTWISSVENKPVLINASSDGLVPLWNLLPSKYSSYQTKLKNEFISYSNSNANTIADKYNISGTTVRTTEVKITDSGPMKEDVDVLDEGALPYSFSELAAKGYKFATVTVSLEMKEVNEGDQAIILLPKGKPYDTKFGYLEISFGGSGAYKYYKPVIFNFASMDISNFLNGLEVRYGAYGFGEDTWYNKNVHITVTVSKEKIRFADSAIGDTWS